MGTDKRMPAFVRNEADMFSVSNCGKISEPRSLLRTPRLTRGLGPAI